MKYSNVFSSILGLFYAYFYYDNLLFFLGKQYIFYFIFIYFCFLNL